jgi:hypothetical protein
MNKPADSEFSKLHESCLTVLKHTKTCKEGSVRQSFGSKTVFGLTFEFLLTSRLNQDPLECTFSVIRGRGGYDRNPSAQRVRRVLQLIINMHLAKPSRTSNTNSEHDDDVNLLTHCAEGIEPGDLNASENIDDPELPLGDDDLIDETDLPFDDNVESDVIRLELPVVQPETANESIDQEGIEEMNNRLALLENEGFLDETELSEEEYIAHLDAQDLEACEASQNSLHDSLLYDNRHPTVESNAVRYYAGYCAKVCLRKFPCVSCKSDMIKDNQTLENTHELLLFNKAYRNKNEDQLGGLCPPTASLHDIAALALRTYSHVAKTTFHHPRILGRSMDAVTRAVDESHPEWLSPDHACYRHRTFFLRHMIYVKIRKDCNWRSKDLRMPKQRHSEKLSASSASSTQPQKANPRFQKLQNLRHT